MVDGGQGFSPPSPKKALGQHFLFDRDILDRIVTGAGVLPGDRVLEIGPGPGGLTRALLEAGARVWAVEADPRMVEYLEHADLPAGLHLRRGDALKTDYPALAAEAGGGLKLVANLPYQISGPLIARLLRQREAFTSLTVMLQLEVADRILASPGGRTCGVLTVLSQAFCRVRPVVRVPPGAFRPPPKVESRVIRLDVLPAPLAPLDDEDTLWRVVRLCFGQRRKMLRNPLKTLGVDPVGLLSGTGVSPTQRPEQLDPTQWIRLANAVHAACGAR